MIDFDAFYRQHAPAVFRFALSLPALPPYTGSPVDIPPPVADLGVALRLSL